MLQVNIIRQNPEMVKQRLAVKNFPDLNIVDEIIELDEILKKLKVETENIQSRINAASKEIGKIVTKGESNTEVETLKKEVDQLKEKLSALKGDLWLTNEKFEAKLVLLPNLPDPRVPQGKGPEDNVVVKENGEKPKLLKDAVPHWELVKKFNLIDFDLGTKITGSGFPVYIQKGAKLQRALISYFLDFNTKAGYLEYLPPYMVNETSAFGTGQLPDKEGQMYFINEDHFYLIPTAEVPVTNIYRDKILPENEVPVKMTAYTPCFRREAGSYGKDVRGLNRLHQFEKVEIVQLVKPEKSYEVLEEMVAHVEALLQSLQLPYRILKLCGADLGFAAALTYDFEVYSAAQDKWLEVSSVSNFETFQTNRMKIRYKDADGKNQLLHSLNGSSMALPRIVASLLENNQSGSFIRLPAVLHPYFGAEQIA